MWEYTRFIIIIKIIKIVMVWSQTKQQINKRYLIWFNSGSYKKVMSHFRVNNESHTIPTQV